MRLGFPVKVLGQPGLKSHDNRRWQNHPHLSVSLAYLRDIFLYLKRQDIRMYRMAADLAPYVVHPDMPEFHSQIEECTAELVAVGELALEGNLRLSFHLPLTVVLNAQDETIARQSSQSAVAHGRILEAMGLGPEAVLVTHVGGLYGDRGPALERFVERFEHLPDVARQRLVLENDDKRFSVSDIHWVHQRTGIPLVFDYLHFRNFNPQGLDSAQALDICLRSWPPGVKPKMHFSSPRTAMRIVERRASRDRSTSPQLRAPRPIQHADFADPFQFIDFFSKAKQVVEQEFDVMLEVKGKDLAVLRLREDLMRFAPSLLGGERND
jgi:UV DNA damage endonuclease